MNKLRDFNIPIPETSDNCIILISVVKNEFLLLDYFIKFYTSIGVTHFIFIENDSSDDTLKYLLELQNNIMLFQTKDSYKDSICGINWINYMLKAYCKDKWCVVADSDEIMRIKHLNVLRDAMIEEGAIWCKFYLLDMYSNTSDKEYIKGEPFVTHSNYYDKESSINNDFNSGVRKRVMNVDVCLTKASFFKYTFYKYAYVIIGQHRIDNLKNTDKKFSITQILLHFKFIKPNLKDVFAKRVKDNQDWLNSKDYRGYLKYINECKFNLYSPEYSLCIEDTEPVFSFI
jgi:hypothetical protein